MTDPNSASFPVQPGAEGQPHFGPEPPAGPYSDAAQGYPPQYQQVPGQPTYPGFNPQGMPPKKKGAGVAIAIVAGVAVLLLALGGILFATGVFDSDSSSDSDEDTSQSDSRGEGDNDGDSDGSDLAYKQVDQFCDALDLSLYEPISPVKNLDDRGDTGVTECVGDGQNLFSAEAHYCATAAEAKTAYTDLGDIVLDDNRREVSGDWEFGEVSEGPALTGQEVDAVIVIRDENLLVIVEYWAPSPANKDQPGTIAAVQDTAVQIMELSKA